MRYSTTSSWKLKSLTYRQLHISIVSFLTFYITCLSNLMQISKNEEWEKTRNILTNWAGDVFSHIKSLAIFNWDHQKKGIVLHLFFLCIFETIFLFESASKIVSTINFNHDILFYKDFIRFWKKKYWNGTFLYSL